MLRTHLDSKYAMYSNMYDNNLYLQTLAICITIHQIWA